MNTQKIFNTGISNTAMKFIEDTAEELNLKDLTDLLEDPNLLVEDYDHILKKITFVNIYDQSNLFYYFENE